MFTVANIGGIFRFGSVLAGFLVESEIIGTLGELDSNLSLPEATSLYERPSVLD